MAVTTGEVRQKATALQVMATVAKSMEMTAGHPRLAMSHMDSILARYEWIIERFHAFIAPEHESFAELQRIFTNLTEQEFPLSSGEESRQPTGVTPRQLHEIRELSSITTGSHSASLKALQERFIPELDTMRDYQSRVALCLSAGLGVERTIYDVGRSDLLALADQAITAFSAVCTREQGAAPVPGEPPPPLGSAELANRLGAPMMQQTELSLGFRLAELATFTPPVRCENGGGTAQVIGETTDDIVASLSAACQQLIEHMNAAENRLNDALQSFQAEVRAHRNSIAAPHAWQG